MELYFLGTGAGMPTTERNVTSIALRMFDERGTFWLFDAGEATQHQILRSPLKPSKLEKIFITHLHGDHIFGLPGLLSSRSHQGGTEPLDIYGPQGVRTFIETALQLSQSHINYELRFHELHEGVIYEDEQCTVESGLLDHRIESYGFRMIEKPRPGKLKVDELMKLGVQPGPMFGKIKQGIDLRLDDGRVIRASDMISEPQPGVIVTILGDTRPCQGSLRLAKDADVLVHEATFMEGLEDLAETYYHSTTKQAAETARDAGVGLLVLTHFSARYSEENPLVEEAKVIFDNTVAAKQHQLVPIRKY
ncbi:ribonuclease Z [Paenibacillus selenitireducens]|uniref:Ribonuclease Z n=1 Tax=Paenibacillus selenitireducens TaxID=1324314 RepID=A0A1T2X439_9BACL|nr:ribonuclease Z [Paenibacillus selenitireducens]OPA74664.1 ribonuclease Z [Paenibacillus selenitireducens]